MKKMNRHTYCTITWRDLRQTFRPSPIQGIGSFALADILAGEVVGIIGSVMMDEAEFQLFVQQQPRFNAIQIDEHLHLAHPRGAGALLSSFFPVYHRPHLKPERGGKE